MEGCKDKWFKQHAIIAFLTVENIPPIDICHHAQAMGINVDISTV